MIVVMTEWKEIPNYEGYYQVSSCGRVKSINKELSVFIDNTGYYAVNLKRKRFRVHQLMAMAFLNHKPCRLNLVVDHIDNNQLNNNLSNLQIITQRENSSKDKNSSSKYIGVHWYKQKNRWRATAYHNGKYVYLGLHKTEISAKQAYDKYILENNL